MPLDLSQLDSVVRIIGDLPNRKLGYGEVRGIRGTGFLCAVPSRNIPGLRYGYVVTAHHVIDGQNRPEVQAPVPLSRGMELQEPVEVLNWRQPLPDVDLAIAQFGGDHVGQYGGLTLDRHFLPPRATPLLGGVVHYIGILEGEDRVMARSGTLGALDQEGLDHPDGYVYTAHLADCRTYGGFSGSPVFAQFDAPVLESFDQSRLPYTWLCGMLTWHLADNRGQYASLYGVVAILRHNEIWEGLMAFQDERDEADKVNAAKIAASKPRPTNVSARQELPEEFARFEDLARQLAHTPKPEQDKSSQ